MHSAARPLADMAMQASNSHSNHVHKTPVSRRGKKAVMAHVDPAAAWQLKKLALDLETTVQALLEEAIGDLFEKNHLPRQL